VSEDFLYRLQQATPRLWVTPTLIAINALVWFAMLSDGMSALSPLGSELLQWGGNRLRETRAEPWRLMSATVLHAGIVHLGFNMWALWDVGRVAERFYGNLQFLMIYLLAGLFGSLASLFFAARMAVSVGASGAIFGVIGALLAALVSQRGRLPPGLARSLSRSLLMFVGVSLLMGFTIGVVDNAAHLGGLIAGFIMALLLVERFDWVTYRRQGLWRALLTLCLAAGAATTLWRWLQA
jgi:rhomboid protease GluP